MYRFFHKDQKATFIYNSKITIENIPAQVYEYVENGNSSIEWMMECYEVNVHKESQIKNDINNRALEVSNPRYIFESSALHYHRECADGGYCEGATQSEI
jgi:predicted helicase